MWKRYAVFGFTVLLLVTGCASSTPTVLRGQATPWIGNEASDLATVTFRPNGPCNMQLQGSFFDNGTIVAEGKQYAPGVWISHVGGAGQVVGAMFPNPGGDFADHVEAGNQICYRGPLMFFRETCQWKRRPGPLVVTLYLNNGQHASTNRVDAEAGKVYNLGITCQNQMITLGQF
jgi:hypothetical protein